MEERLLEYLAKSDNRQLHMLVHQLYTDCSVYLSDPVITTDWRHVTEALRRGDNLPMEDLDRIRAMIVNIHGPERGLLWAKGYLNRNVARARKPPAQVPRLAEQVACLLVPRADADATMGDLEEKFHKYAIRYGQRYSMFWYWWQVGSLIGPRLRNMLLWLGGLVGLKKAFDWIGKLGGS